MGAMKTDLPVEELELNEEMKDLPMLQKYDSGVQRMIEQVFAGSVIFAPVDRAFDLFIGQKKEKIRFPFISLFPTNGYTLTNKNYQATNIGKPLYKAAHIYNDDTLEYEGQRATLQNYLQYYYFTIPYQIDCWSTSRKSALQLVQELVFWLKSQGQVKVKYREHEFKVNLILDDNIQDSSTYVQYADIGNLYRFTFMIQLDAPIIRTTNYLNITKADIEIDMKEES